MEYTIFCLATLYNYRCLTGYTIGKLLPHHSEVIQKDILGEPATLIWIRRNIENLQTFAVYPEEDLSMPAAWIMEYPHREIGYIHTSGSHRRKGLGRVVTVALCRSLLEDCPDIPPYATAEEGNLAPMIGMEELGFVHSGYITVYY